MILNYKNIFLIDATGAATSALVIALILPHIFSEAGLPVSVLYFLAAVALLFAAFSSYCYRFASRSKIHLLVIMLANLAYCLLTAAVVAIYFNEMVIWERAYFAVEILIIFSLVVVEHRVLSTLER